MTARPDRPSGHTSDMKRRRVIVGLAVLALVAVNVLVVWPTGSRLCRVTFDQVREGMTYDEVCETVGASPDGASLYNCRIWYSKDHQLLVWFNGSDRVANTMILPRTDTPEPTVWSRIRARLGLAS
jgi:hypothetical protein